MPLEKFLAVFDPGSTNPSGFGGRYADALPFNVQDFGAKGDGVTDDTGAIQAAINAAAGAGGGIVLLPVGVFLVTNTLTIHTSGIQLQGQGSWYNTDVGAVGAPSRIVWGGGAGGTVLDIEPVAGGAAQALKAIVLADFAILGQGVAAVGVLAQSIQGSWYRNLYVERCTTACLDFNVIATLGENRGVTRCIFERLSLRDTTGASILFRASGDATANFSNNDILDLACVYFNGGGIQLGNADSNRFWSVNCNRVGGGAGIGVELLANAAAAQVARANLFGFLSSVGGGVTARGTPSAASPSVNNVILYYSRENGEPAPVVEAGATVDILGGGRAVFGYTTSPAALAAGATNNYAPGFLSRILRLSANAAGSNLTGLVAGMDGQRVTIVNISANTLTLNNNNAGSAAGNRFLFGTGADVVLGANDSVDIWYDASSGIWRGAGFMV